MANFVSQVKSLAEEHGVKSLTNDDLPEDLLKKLADAYTAMSANAYAVAEISPFSRV